MNKKLLFVINVDWFFVSHRLPIALEAITQGYEVHLVTSFTTKREEIESYGICCHEINFSRSGSSPISEIKTLFDLRSIIKALNVDILHAVTIKPVLYTGLLLHSLSRKPAVVFAISGLGYVFSAINTRAKITKFLVSCVYKIAFLHINKLIIFQNSSDKHQLSKITHLTKVNHTVIKGSGADLTVYKYKPEPDTPNVIITMACRLIKDKGIYEFVDAARRIKKSHPETEFWLIGSVDPNNPNSVKQYEVDFWASEGLINAFGYRDDIPHLFSLSNVVTLPSYYGEGVPKVLIEASACGRPIVTTNMPGCKDSIIPNETGLLVPPRDSISLTEALISLLSDSSLRLSMGQKAREFAKHEFDIRSVVNKHMAIYTTLLNNTNT